jgi:hypothetical protein
MLANPSWLVAKVQAMELRVRSSNSSKNQSAAESMAVSTSVALSSHFTREEATARKDIVRLGWHVFERVVGAYSLRDRVS